MAGKPTIPTMQLPVTQHRPQTAAGQIWAPPTSSSPSYLPPTPTKDIHDLSSHSPDRLPSTMSKHPKPWDIRNLMSPPEPAPLDAFKATGSATGEPASSSGTRIPLQPLSPPVSPFSRAANTINIAPLNLDGKDPILYPASEASSSAPTGPLFSLTPESVENFKAATEHLVSEHIASRPTDLFRDSSPPRVEDYELALYFKSNCLRMFKDNPRQWLRKERELLRADRKHTALPSQPTRLPPILPAARPAVLGPQSTKAPTTRVRKPKSARAKAQNPRPIRATPAPAPETIRVSTPEPRARTVAPNREDKNFAALVDLSPPLDMLPPKLNGLKAEWRGNALDLSKDTNQHLLHPDELLLASRLRLDCATYLTTKRRMFLRRLECAKIGKEFRKTDAQQACKIDVNKASKLWTAYHAVGWLHIDWIRKFMDPSEL